MYKLTEILCTCEGCPSQWEGTTTNDESVYIRYRWGHGRVEINDETVFTWQSGSDLDGIMSYEEMKGFTGNILDFGNLECSVKMDIYE